MSHIDGSSPGTHDKSDHGGVDRELNMRFIVSTVLSLGGVTLLAFVLMAVMVPWMETAERADDPKPSPLPEANEKWVPPGPRLQEFPPTVDIEALHAREDLQLSTFAWVDEDSGVVRIPIETAVEVLVRRGLPVRGQVDALSAELFGAAGPPEDNGSSEGTASFDANEEAR